MAPDKQWPLVGRQGGAPSYGSSDFGEKQMQLVSFVRPIGLALALLFGMGLAGNVVEAADALGPEKCQKCHKPEVSVWKGTKHAKSFKTTQKSDKAKPILKAVDEKRMRKAELCQTCHYTVIGGRAKEGPSCESCHGNASEWFEVHNNYGEGAKRETESAEHKAQRIKSAADKGMIWPSMTYDVASNCMSCHGLGQDALSGDTIAKMIDAGHPINPEFELVRYSQGSVKHRFYPPNMDTNADMTPAELSRTFIAGHAASIVAATAALKKSDHPKYVEAQNARIAAAKAALDAIKGSVPEAGALAGSPSEANARKLVAAIEGKDLSGAVGGMLPDKGTYK